VKSQRQVPVVCWFMLYLVLFALWFLCCVNRLTLLLVVYYYFDVICQRSFLVHGQVTIIFVVSVCLSVCLFVCLFVCAEFFSAVFDPISIKLGHVICLGLVVSPRI